MTDPFDAFEDATYSNVDEFEMDPPARTEAGMWNGKPLPEGALLNDDGTPQLTPTGRVKRTRSGAPAGSKSSNRKSVSNEQLAADLCDPLAKVGLALSFTLPTAAGVIMERGEKTAAALVAIAAGHPKMLAALQRASKVGPAADLVETGLMIAIAVMMDTGNMPPEHPIGQITGVGALYFAVHGGKPPEESPPPPDFGPHVDYVEYPPFETKEHTGDIADPNHDRYTFSAGEGAGSVTPPVGGPFGGMFPA